VAAAANGIWAISEVDVALVNELIRSPLDGVVLALDVDGVVLTTSQGEQRDWKSTFGERFDVDAEQLVTEFFARAWPEVIRGNVAIEPTMGDAINRLGWTMSVDEALDAWFEADFTPDLEVVAAAREWSDLGVRLVVVTNQEHRRAAYLRRRLLEVLPVEDVLYSAALGYVKDEQEFYTAADAQLRERWVDPSVVFVDDTLKNVVAARNHGWRAIHFEQSSLWRSLINQALIEAAGGANG
jgi:putative hydrolase of the HAD superfamily